MTRSSHSLFLSFFLTLTIIPVAFGAPADDSLWTKFQSTRQAPRALHQEFAVTRRVKTGEVERLSRYQLILDISQNSWREQFVGGADDRLRVFDGQELYELETGGTEYTHVTRKNDKDENLPSPYDTKIDWRKLKEVKNLPCGFSGKDHTCVIIEAPIKPWARPSTPGNFTTMKDGTIRVMIDTETGIWLNCQIVATVESSHATSAWVIAYNIKQMSYGADSNASLFKLPDSLHEVKELTHWDESRIRKELVGKATPEMEVTDLQGNTISLANLRGKTVLLDFWTTWCPPCQADGPSLEKLNQKYGKGNLAIVGISVDEEREVVEKYLKKHPHTYPVVLTNENQIPRPYQISVFPTYLIVSPDGVLMTAQQGDQGFGKLRKDLEKAGVSPE